MNAGHVRIISSLTKEQYANILLAPQREQRRAQTGQSGDPRRTAPRHPTCGGGDTIPIRTLSGGHLVALRWAFGVAPG